MDQIKEAFTKVKQDILTLQEEFIFLKEEMNQLKVLSLEMLDLIKKQEQAREKKYQHEQEVSKNVPARIEEIPTERKDIPTENSAFKPLNGKNKGISTGNEGVPTDRQTNQQTNQQTHFLPISKEKGENYSSYSKPTDHFQEAVGALESLDNIKKELRLQFKRLTDQELLVFSTLYQLEEEEGGNTDYKTLSIKLKLTESSIRDYIGKLIKKGIPVEKIKINNKTIHLKVSPNLRKIASLQTILLLRDI